MFPIIGYGNSSFPPFFSYHRFNRFTASTRGSPTARHPEGGRLLLEGRKKSHGF